MRQLFSRLRSLLFPQYCLLCETPAATTLCASCASQLRRTSPACAQCALPLATATQCGACLRTPPLWQQAQVPFVYDAYSRHLIHQLKFARRLYVARALACAFVHALPTDALLPDCIIPIPLHKKRLAERHFNQSFILAKEIGKQLHIPVYTDVCQRIRNTESQTGMSRAQRAKNLRGAFIIRHGEKVTGKRIVLLDDVYTTGATFNALARLLQPHKPAHIEVWAMARTVKN